MRPGEGLGFFVAPDTWSLPLHSGQNTLRVTANEKAGQFGFRGATEGFESDSLADKNGTLVRFLMTECRWPLGDREIQISDHRAVGGIENHYTKRRHLLS